MPTLSPFLDEIEGSLTREEASQHKYNSVELDKEFLALIRNEDETLRKMYVEDFCESADHKGYIKVQLEQKNNKIQGGGTRGKIRGFSGESRKRMLDVMQKADYEKMTKKGNCSPKFVTLTYGQLWPKTAKESKKHLFTLFKRIERKFKNKDISGLWKLEYQKRGAFHFHILFFGFHFLDKDWLQQAWAEIIGVYYLDLKNFKGRIPNAVYKERKALKAFMAEHPEVRAPFTKIEKIRSLNGCMYYIGKYLAKTDEKEEEGTEMVRTAGFNCVAYLTVHKLKENQSIVERCLNRALEALDCSFHEGMSDEDRKQEIGRIIRDYANPKEMDILCPPVGRVWGILNKKSLNQYGSKLYAYFLDLEKLERIKVWARGLRHKTTFYKGEKGFTLYFNEPKERRWFYDLLKGHGLTVPF